jgi:hypothetical protein
MSLQVYAADDAPSPRLSVADARTLRRLADAAEREDVYEPEFVAARAAVEIDVDDAAIATIAAAEAMGRSPPGWAVRKAAGGEVE